MRVRSTVDGEITALRFYKAPGSPGPHTGHLWTESGTLLATVSFDNETASGWQQAALPVAVPVLKSQAYVVSCFHPGGVFGYSTGYFTASGIQRGPFYAEQSTDGARSGLFVYGPGGFPASCHQNTNYWVDAVFNVPPDVSAPTLANVIPAPGLIAVARHGTIVATFDEPVDPDGLTFTLTDTSGSPVAGTTTYQPETLTAVLTPAAPLAVGASYTASISARDLLGNAMAGPYVWSFTTAVAPNATPATLWDTQATPTIAAADDPAQLEVGVRFNLDRAGAITGVRFYKGAGNLGPHVGHLWTAAGELLATAPFTNETALGWQQANFAAPVPVSPGVSYVASYFAPAGRYAVDLGYFSGAATHSAPLHSPATSSDAGNGVFAYSSGAFPASTWGGANYWVDAIFQDLAAPTVSTQAPAAGSVDVALNAAVSAVFDEAVQPASIAFEVRDGGGALLAGSVSYDGPSRTATFTPAGALSAGSTYTASVSGIVDLDGNAMAVPSVWSFTTAIG